MVVRKTLSKGKYHGAQPFIGCLPLIALQALRHAVTKKGQGRGWRYCWVIQQGAFLGSEVKRLVNEL